jgi:glutaminyl-tRNA synthetase
VRLRWGYIVKCTGVVKDDGGDVVEVRCTYDPASRGGTPADGRKVKSTIHWVSAAHAVDAEVRLYDRLFDVEDPSGDDWLDHLNRASLERIPAAKLEPSLRDAAPGSRWQFERIGYFCADPVDSRPGAPVFNRTVTLRDTWAKIEQRQAS